MALIGGAGLYYLRIGVPIYLVPYGFIPLPILLHRLIRGPHQPRSPRLVWLTAITALGYTVWLIGRTLTLLTSDERPGSVVASSLPVVIMHCLSEKLVGGADRGNGRIMRRNDFLWLLVILAVIIGASLAGDNPSYPIRLGLDLQGGLQVLLEADVPPDQDITAAQMDTSRQVVDRRVNALGVTEPLVQVEGDRRILIELPGVDDPEEAIALIQETALLGVCRHG